MRYIADDNGYLLQVSFGAMIECNGRGCVEYTGAVPSGYVDLADWFTQEADKLHRWHIVKGDLTLDSEATEPEVYVPPAPEPTVSMTLLWTNDKPSQNFGAQTLALDLSGYDAVFMLVGSTTTWMALLNSFAPVGDILLTVDGSKYRSATTSKTGLVFTDAYNVSTLSNNSLIPYMIYGVNTGGASGSTLPAAEGTSF